MTGLGDQTLEFVTLTQSGTPGWGGVRETTETPATVEGCHFRPVATTETDAATDTATETWKATCPPEQVVLAAKPNGVIRYNGGTFQIDGPVQPKSDLSGGVHHVTVMCKRQSG